MYDLDVANRNAGRFTENQSIGSNHKVCARPEWATLSLASLPGYQLGEPVVYFGDSISRLPQMTIVSLKPFI